LDPSSIHSLRRRRSRPGSCVTVMDWSSVLIPNAFSHFSSRTLSEPKTFPPFRVQQPPAGHIDFAPAPISFSEASLYVTGSSAFSYDALFFTVDISFSPHVISWIPFFFEVISGSLAPTNLLVSPGAFKSRSVLQTRTPFSRGRL